MKLTFEEQVQNYMDAWLEVTDSHAEDISSIDEMLEAHWEVFSNDPSYPHSTEEKSQFLVLAKEIWLEWLD